MLLCSYKEKDNQCKVFYVLAFGCCKRDTMIYKTPNDCYEKFKDLEDLKFRAYLCVTITKNHERGWVKET